MRPFQIRTSRVSATDAGHTRAHHARSGKITLLTCAAIAILSGAGALSMFTGPGDVTTDQLRLGLIRAGADPVALAAAGALNSQTDRLAADGRIALDPAANPSNTAELAAADAALATANATIDRVRRNAQAGVATSDDLTALRAAETSAANAISQRNTVLARILATSASSLTEAQRATLAAIRANPAASQLSPYYAVVSRTSADHVRLRDALANVRIAAKLGIAANPESTTIVNTANADPAVAAARQAWSTNAPSVTTAWLASTAR